MRILITFQKILFVRLLVFSGSFYQVTRYKITFLRASIKSMKTVEAKLIFHLSSHKFSFGDVFLVVCDPSMNEL